MCLAPPALCSPSPQLPLATNSQTHITHAHPLFPPPSCAPPPQGAFSEVHLAVDTHSGAAVALKVVFLNRPGLRPQEVRGGGASWGVKGQVLGFRRGQGGG
jgi:hypothetical protein